MSTAYSPNVPIAQELIQDVIAVMARLGDDYVPPVDPGADARPPVGGGLQDAGLTPEKLDSLRASYEAWPEDVLLYFHQASGVLAQVLQMFGARPTTGGINPLDLLSSDPEMYHLLTTALSMPDGFPMSGDEQVDAANPTVTRSVLLAEVERRVISARTPFAATVTTMLGHDALRWLFAPNSTGSPYLQPHEFSRTGWIRLTRIRDQLEIEQELARFGSEHAAHAKIVVCLVWTVAALAGLMEPDVFLTERDAFVSSLRSGGLTVSTGIVNHTIVNFSARSMRDALQVLHDGLTDELITACDLMWMANGMARWRSVTMGYAGERLEQHEQYSVFLSHRGCDAKNELAQALLRQPGALGVFLDCLTLPRGVINRSFVFGAIGRSRQVVLVDTAKFAESDWCLKELWFAEQLEKLGLTTLRRWSLAEAIEGVLGIEAVQTDDDIDRAYAIAPRVLSDARYYARSPNLFSLEKLRAIPSPLERAEKVAAASDALATEAAASLAAQEVIGVLDAAVRESPRGEPIDLWGSAAQLAVSILGANAKARSKMEVRAGIDSMNAVLGGMAADQLFADGVFCKRASRYLACLAAAVVSDLAGFRLDQFTAQAVREAIGDAAILREGLLLLDVRESGPQREFHMRFALALLSNDVSAVGILQSADDHVHELVVDGRSLEVLPCVTLHPGMETLFPEL
jgi:hypothetical protein